MTLARLAPAILLPEAIAPITTIVGDARANGDLKWGMDSIRSKLDMIRTRDAYYNGNHELAYATKQWKSEFGKMLRAFNANYCPAVVDAVADRLRLTGVAVVGDNDKPDEALATRLKDVWDRQRMDRRAGQIHTAMLKHAEAYVTVWPHPQTNEPTYYIARGDRIAVRYSSDDPDEPLMAVKIWMEGNRCRATVYYADHIERWATPERSTFTGMPTSATSFEPYGDDWYLDHEYGVVPVVAFVNNPTEDGVGISELDNVIPLQRALNISMAEMLVALEYAAYPQRWAVGLIETRDPLTGEVSSEAVGGPERLWTSDSHETRFGQFDTANMSNFVAAQDAIRADIARVSRTPINYLLMQGVAVSGEALRVMEAPLMAKVIDRQDTTGPSWEQLARLTLIVAGAANADDRAHRYQTNWRDTSSRGDLDHARAIQIKRELGVSERQGLIELGYESDKIDEMQEEREVEAADVADAATNAFNRGQITGEE